MTIGVIDTGINNLGSIFNALDHIKCHYEKLNRVDQIKDCKKFILPGVGSFDACADALQNAGWLDTLRSMDWETHKIMGICVGMQIFCTSSDEGVKSGLGLLDAEVEGLSEHGCNDKTPHVGFNETKVEDPTSDFMAKINQQDFYFIHSYAVLEINSRSKIEMAVTNYGGLGFISAFKLGNIYGTQFHPEKSGTVGLDVIRAFAEC